MVFKNEKQLKDFLMSKCKDALINTQEQVYRILEKFMQKYYADYSPELYERTYQLYRSLIKCEITPTPNGYKTEVGFDIGGLQYMSGAQPSGEQVMKAASNGYHGAIGVSNGVALKFVAGDTGTVLWNEQLRVGVQAEALKILKNMIIAEGIPIK